MQLIHTRDRLSQNKNEIIKVYSAYREAAGGSLVSEFYPFATLNAGQPKGRTL